MKNEKWKIINLLRLTKNRELIAYLVIGVLTTLINVVVYQCMTHFYKMDTLPANFIAWVVAVLFAFVTNDQIVFVHEYHEKPVYKRLGQFILCRAASLAIDEAGMYLLVDCLFVNGLISKILMNAIVIIINYILSKKVIFQ